MASSATVSPDKPFPLLSRKKSSTESSYLAPLSAANSAKDVKRR